MKISLPPITSKQPMESPCLTLASAAAFLHLAPKTLRGLVDAGRIPCQRAGRRYVFYRPTLEAWAAGTLNASAVGQ